ncbi:hypothetical protein Patl1_23437 [Pistacia atlantica]|uniref:Uncharacterized protein n=1 Tax=Pistacia atlantica TaxID=434234 RepID=A0ACC1A463_9ROSI|nr:hypothetical protein Patl1_23437 [Pistacia atlantica]
MMYTPDDVKEIVEFGLSHGVRVVPEIDSPALTQATQELTQKLLRVQTCFGGQQEVIGSTGLQQNPLNPKTYEVLKNVIADVVKLFPEPFYHGGADRLFPVPGKLIPPSNPSF